MSFNLKKIDDGSYRPFYRGDVIASDKIKVGDEVKATKDRNPQFHRKAFALLKMAFENQDRYDNKDIFRQILTIKAGYVNWVKGDNGVDYPFAHSWAFESMGQDEFEEMYKAIKEVIIKELKITDQQILEEIQNHY